MKRIVLVVVGIVAVAPHTYAQSDAVLIEQALSAASGRAGQNATVIKWNADQTYTTIQEGTNQVVCYSRADERDRPAFAVQCTTIANLELVAQNRKFRAQNGTRVPAAYGSFFTSANGADQAGAFSHTTISMPGATTASSGFPDNPKQGGAGIMAAGTSEAHLMLP